LLAGLFILALTAAAADDQPRGTAATTAVVAERVPLPRLHGPIKLVVDSLGARLQIEAPKDKAAVAIRIAAHAAWICPQITENPTGLDLRCRTRRLDATLTTDKGASYLDIRELRGLPWRQGAGGAPFFFYSPEATRLGGACPGTTPAGMGECLLQNGTPLEAARQFRLALRTPNRQLAALRLGDIALFTGDPATALAWYDRTGTLGVYGRVARTRTCEIDGNCLGSTLELLKIFDSSGLPLPVRAEMTMRTIRAEAYQDHFAAVLKLLADKIGDHGPEALCAGSVDRLCRRILLEIIRQKTISDEPEEFDSASPYRFGASAPVVAGGPKTKKEDAPAAAARAAADKDEQLALAEKALSLYLTLPNWDRGPYAVELAQAAADSAQRMGAPTFGGNILAAVAPMVPSAALPEHLAHAAELFIEGGEEMRARVLVEYAMTLPAHKVQTARWKAIQRGLAALDPSDRERLAIDPEAVAKETAAALAVSGRAREVMQKLATAAGGQGGQP
jgi:hypothetical protein